MAKVQISDAEKYYGGHQALKGISINIEDGEFVVLVGPSGCGKSTLLRMVAGLEDITFGTVDIGGVVVNDLAAKDRDIAMVFQNYALYPHKTVAANMGFSLKMAKVPKLEAQKRVQHAAEILGLSDLLERFPRQLSGGQRQRVAMGRAIVRDPAVFLFDEPLSNLDAKLRVQMRAEIKELHQKLKTTTIYVTHDQVEAMTMADKIVVMRDGVVEQIGAPLDLYDNPVNTFVAEFIGSPSMNLIPGQLTETDFRSESGVHLPTTERHEGAAFYGVRPEHLHLDDNGIEMQVTVVEPIGAEVQILGKIGGFPVVAVLKDRINPEAGSIIRLSPEPGSVHLFGKDGTVLTGAH